MADEIQRTIYKLEIDDSGYIRGIDSLSASTQRFAQVQDSVNKKLAEAKIALKAATDETARQQRELDNANRSGNTGVIKVREDALKKAQTEQAKLTELVKQTEIEYEKATKAATDFANTTAKAGSLTQGGRVPVPPVVQQPVQQIVPPVALQDFNLSDAASASAAEFEQLRGAIAAAELALEGMNQESEEFKALAPAVDAGKKALADYDAAAEKAGGSTLSLRSQIRQGREELVKLEAQGKGNTKQYFELEKNVARLTDAFGDQQQRIKILASDTKALDFGKGAITAATAAFSAYTSVSILAGEQSEEMQKKTLQLFAAMQLLQSLEQLSNLTRREGVLATLAQSGAQAAYTAVVGASTGAMKAFRIALAATGIGLAVIAITALIQKFRELQEAEEAAAVEQKALLDISKQAVDSYAEEVTHLKLLSAEYSNSATSLKRKKDIQDELQKSYPEYFKNLDTQADKEAFVAEQIGKVTQALILQAKIQAAQGLLSKKFADLLKQQFDPTEAVGFLDVVGSTLRNITGSLGDVGTDLSKTAQSNISKAQAEYNKFEKFIIDFVNGSNAELEKLGGDPKKDPKKPTKAVDNVFEQEKLKLNARIAELKRVEETGIEAINREFESKLLVEQKRIADLLKDKKLTRPQAKILVQLAVDANQLELDKALADFNKKVLDAREKLNDDLRKLQDTQTEESLNLIQDEFERRRALIDFNEKQELADAIERNEDRLAALDLDRLLLGEEAYQNAKNIIITTGEQEANNILARFAALRKDLAADTFRDLLDSIGAGLQTGLIFRDENLAQEIRDASDRFLQGKITYEQFQKELTAIQKREEGIRRDATLSNQRSELSDLDSRIATITDKTSEEFKVLTQRRKDLRAKIAQGEKEDAIKDAEDTNTDANTQKVETLNDYVVAVGDLANSVIQFWQAANEAESAALDRSISLQEKRVTAAQRIAERGNAQYLKAEEDRLKELTIKRENAARRELAINTALQASQLLVGITGAISKIATPGIGIAESIGAFAVIVSSLAAGYGLVKSLQGSQPRLAKGDPYVKRGNNPSGVDTIPAWLNEGEAVIPTETNRKYHPTIKAIYDEKIPAEDINQFVKNYHSIKLAPKVNYDRIKESAELNVTHDGRMSVALQEQNKLIVENNDLQRQTLRAMKTMSVSANIDRDGVAISVNEYIAQMNLNKKI